MDQEDQQESQIIDDNGNIEKQQDTDENQENNPFKRIQLNEEDRDFLRFLEAKLTKTEQKIQTVQYALRESETFQAENTSRLVDEAITSKQVEIKPEEVKGSLHDNYIDLYTKHKQLESDMEQMVQKFEEKNRQINLLIRELKRSKQSEELCIKKMADMKLQLENSQPNSSYNNIQQQNSYKQQNKEKENKNKKQTYNYNNINQQENHLQKSDNFNFWTDKNSQKNQISQKQNLQEILGEVNGGGGGAGLWVMEHDLRKRQKEQQKILQDKYPASLGEEQQQLLDDVHYQQQLLMQQEQMYGGVGGQSYNNENGGFYDQQNIMMQNSLQEQTPIKNSQKSLNSQNKKLNPINSQLKQNSPRKYTQKNKTLKRNY